MRNKFISSLVKFAREDDRIILIVGDLGYGVIEPFVDEFPDRFFNAGVAEQNMVGLAAGLVSEGMRPFVYSIANFPTFRCAEQIRNDVSYHQLPVTIVSVGSGLSYGALGYSHHAVQDISLMRSFPETLICTPCDPNEVHLSLEYLLKHESPAYLRIGKAGEDNISSINGPISDAQPRLISSFNKHIDLEPINIIVPGSIIGLVIKFIEKIHNQKINLFSLPVWGSNSNQQLIQFISKFKKLLIIEEHLLSGGFGSWVLESIHESNLSKDFDIKILPLDKKVCGEVASQAELINFGGINESNFRKIISEF